MKKKEYKAIFWDNDGILVDTEKLYMWAARDVLEPLGISVTDEAYIQLNLVEGIDISTLLQQLGLPVDQVATIKQQIIDRFTEYVQTDLEVFDGVEETLRSLHKKYRMGVVTDSRRVHYEAIHDQLPLRQYFDFENTQCDVGIGVRKPDPGPYLAALKLTGLKADEVLAIEDSIKGLRSAKAAGLDCWIIPHALTKNLDFESEGADKILGSVRDLEKELIK